jgi:hypothetical protein
MENDHPDNSSSVLEEESSISDELMGSPQCCQQTESAIEPPASQDIKVSKCLKLMFIIAL